MAASHLDPLLAEAEGRALVLVLRAHLDWTLGDVFEHLYNGPRERLTEAGKVERTGKTSTTRYRVLDAEAS